MCGIFGFGGAPSRDTLVAMGQALRHRGPDDAGYWESGDISLGMRRLAIVDVENGRQPVFNEDGSIVAVFNGEIYNHRELRRELEAAGHCFRTDHADSEVLVHLYEADGDGFLRRLNGMFAIALWDARRRRLLLARDRMGIKPLYLAQRDGQLLFASEIKALLCHPSLQSTPDYQALYHYFSFKHVPAPHTAFAGMEQLRPGELAVFEQGRLRKETWWRLRFDETEQIGEADAAGRIRALLEDSVRSCMDADVPIGAYLSGGLDSSSVVALMSRLGGRRIQTFSLVYADDFPHKAEDQRYARKVAEQYGTDHHEYVLSGKEVADSVDEVLAAFDEPFSGVTSTYFVTRLIARHVKVALSGDGADELFGSYLAHRLAQPLYHYGRLPAGAPSEKDLALLAPYQDRLEMLADYWQKGDEAARRMALYLWDDAGKRGLLSEKMLSLCGGGDSAALIRAGYAASGSADPLNRALYVDFTTLLPDQVLTFVDRLSMAHSVEVRPPFLDHRLVEFAARLPGSYKIRAGRVKHILKQAVADLLPSDVVERPKEGFVLPIDQWLLGSLRDWMEALLAPHRLQAHGLLKPESVRRLLDEHYATTANHGPRLWNLAMFQLWWERCFGPA